MEKGDERTKPVGEYGNQEDNPINTPNWQTQNKKLTPYLCVSLVLIDIALFHFLMH